LSLFSCYEKEPGLSPALLSKILLQSD